MRFHDEANGIIARYLEEQRATTAIAGEGYFRLFNQQYGRICALLAGVARSSNARWKQSMQNGQDSDPSPKSSLPVDGESKPLAPGEAAHEKGTKDTDNSSLSR
jgi:hypothetical protein